MGKKVLITSDTHVGSEVAIMPQCGFGKDYTELKTKKPNSMQRKIYKLYQAMCDDVGKVDIHINLGDTCDGLNKKAFGKGQWTNNLIEQAYTAAYIENLIKTNKRIVLQGSYYHVGSNMSSDELVAILSKAEYDSDISLQVDKTKFYFRHFIGTSRSIWAYKTTQVAREMVLGELNKDEYGKFNIYGFGHIHSFVAVEYGHSYGFTCPCWKLRGGYEKQVTLAWLPHLGYLLFEIDGKNWERFKHVVTFKGKDIIKEIKI